MGQAQRNLPIPVPPRRVRYTSGPPMSTLDFEIDLGPGVTSVTPVLGPGSPSVRDGRIVLDAFTGIDGRVYRVEYR